MKQFLTIAFALYVGLAARADDDAQKIIDKALKAVGRSADDKLGALTWKGKGIFYGMGNEIAYTGTWSTHYPDKSRVDIDNAFTIVVNGDKGWMSQGGNVMELTKDQMDEQRESIHADYVLELVPLRGKEYTLKVTGESKVDDKAVIGVLVSRKGRRDCALYFDKETGLPSKMRQTVKENDKELEQETIIKEYMTVGKVKVPGKILVKREGKNYVDGEVTEYKFVDKLPDGTFEKP